MRYFLARPAEDGQGYERINRRSFKTLNEAKVVRQSLTEVNGLKIYRDRAGRVDVYGGHEDDGTAIWEMVAGR